MLRTEQNANRHLAIASALNPSLACRSPSHHARLVCQTAKAASCCQARTNQAPQVISVLCSTNTYSALATANSRAEAKTLHVEALPHCLTSTDRFDQH